MSAALSIVFTGLCALAADGRGPSQMLLVDTRGVAPGLPSHAPTLVVELRDIANPDTSAPTRVVLGPASTGGAAAQIGLWDLTGAEVRVRVPGRDPSAPELYRPASAASSWPNPPRDADDPAAWRDVRFVPRMSALVAEGRIRPELVASPDDTPAVFPRGVAGRVVIDGGRVEAGLPSERAYRGQVFEFRGARGEPRLRQAMTDTVRWTVDDREGPIVVEIIRLAGGSVKRLVFAPSAAPRRVFVSNLPADNGVNQGHDAHAHADLGDASAAALHFDAYYELLENAPADRPIPMLAGAASTRKATGMARPLICSPVLFDQR
jgi:hypothetical protein